MADPRIRPTGQNLGQTTRPQPGSFGVTRPASHMQTGDVVQGEITDLHNNEITITTGDNTVIRGQIEDGSKLSIGQTAAFRLTGISANGPLLEAIPNSYSETELTMIRKALQEAGLPVTERNQAAVKALMDNLLPINKQSIMNLMQQAYDYSTEDMNTLAIMNRNHMTITPDTVAQFSNYRNQQYQLLYKAESFAQKIPALLDTLAGNGPAHAVADFGEKLLAITLSGGRETTAPLTLSVLTAQQQEQLRTMLSQTALSEEQRAALGNRNMTLQEALTLIRDAAIDGTLLLPETVSSNTLGEKMREIQAVLEPATPAENLPSDSRFHAVTEQAVLHTDVPDEGTTAAPQPAMDSETAVPAGEEPSSRFALAGKLLHNLSDAARSSFQNLNQMLSPGTSNAQLPQVLDSLVTALQQNQYERDAMNYLSLRERNSLLQALEPFDISSALKDRISSGQASSLEVLRSVQAQILLADARQVQQLFQAPAFQNLFSHVLLSSLTLTPKELQERGPVEYYRELEQKLNSFERLIQSSLSGNDSSQLSREAHDMRSNIDFMKLLNETFSYLQLPLRLQNQKAHGDLYVYTSKKQRKENPEKLSVLLHLDMEHLGPVDIRLEKDHLTVDAAFYLDNQPSLQLIRNNTSLLENALAEKGYQCTVRAEAGEKTADIVNDFLNTKVTTGSTHEMKRFSFDVRA